MTARVRHGIQFVQLDKINSELRVVGSDDAGMFLWAAQWLDEHRGFIVNAARFEATPDPSDEADLTATMGDQLEPRRRTTRRTRTGPAWSLVSRSPANAAVRTSPTGAQPDPR